MATIASRAWGIAGLNRRTEVSRNESAIEYEARSRAPAVCARLWKLEFLSRKQLAKNQPQRVDIGPGSHLVPEIRIDESFDLLGRHVRQGPTVQSRPGMVSRVGRLSQVEIE